MTSRRRLPARPGRVASSVLPLLAVAACAGADSASRGAEVVDSAGVTVVSSPGEDRALTVDLVPDFRLGGTDDESGSFYEVGRSTVAAGPEGIAVLDSDGRRVLVFDDEGSHLRTVGGAGGGPGELSWPISVLWGPGGRVMVRDLARRTLVAWDDAGEPVEGPALPEEVSGGTLAAVDDHLLASTRSVDPPIRALVRIRGGVAVDTVASVEEEEGRVVSFESCGMQIGGMQPLFTPALRWAVGGGRIAVVEDAAYVVDLYEGGERVRSVRRGVEPRPATEELAVAEVGEGMRVATPAGERVCDPTEVAEQAGFAEVVPAVRRVALAPDGGLWVERWMVDGPAPVDVFDSGGVYRGTLPEGTPLPLAFLPDGRALWSETDELDVERLVVGTVRWAPADGTGG